MPKSDKYIALDRRSHELKQKNDCVVIAYAVATDTDYDTALYINTELHAFEPGKGGRSWHLVLDAYRMMGYDLSLHYAATAKTAISAERAPELQKGRYLLFMRNGSHIAAMVDGTVHDWTKGRRHTIQHIWKVEPSDNPQVEKPAWWRQ